MTSDDYSSRRTLITALLPVVVANLCYVVSTQSGYIPLCLTYFEGCTSISSTGRHGLGYVLFKVTMLPQAALLWVFWGQSSITAPDHPLDGWPRRLGRLGAMFLVIYVVFLGAETPIYALMRRYGVFVYFIATFVAMTMISRDLWKQAGGAHSRFTPGVLCMAMLVLGLAEIPLGKFGLADNQAENIIEWNFALLMQLWFLAFWWQRRTRRGA